MRFKNKNIFYIILISFVLFSQENEIEEDEADYETGEVIQLETQKIRVEPIKPQLELKRKDIKPEDYNFFKSFEDEVKAVPRRLFDIELRKEEKKVDNYQEILKKTRK